MSAGSGRRIAAAVAAAAATALAHGGCENDYSYSAVVAERPDIEELVACDFEPTEEGWEQYSCSPVFSAGDVTAADWERESLGEFDIAQREIFGAPFYQMWYSAGSGSGNHVGYAISMDGTRWWRHPWNPVLRQGRTPASFDRNDASVACAAFDGDTGVYHLWYAGTNSSMEGTTFGHATSPDGVIWTKDPLNPLDPFEDVDSELSRVWGCDALYDAGNFHFWVGGVTWDDLGGIGSQQDWLDSVRYDVGYLSSVDGAHFGGDGDLVLEHTGLLGDDFDAEGVHKPSVFTFGEGGDGEPPPYWMMYSGYRRVTATPDPQTDLVFIEAQGLRLGMASSRSAGAGWERLSTQPIPLDFSGLDRAESPRAFFINGRVHVFFTDLFPDEDGEPTVPGIGLGIAPFPREGT